MYENTLIFGSNLISSKVYMNANKKKRLSCIEAPVLSVGISDL